MYWKIHEVSKAFSSVVITDSINTDFRRKKFIFFKKKNENLEDEARPNNAFVKFLRLSYTNK